MAAPAETKALQPIDELRGTLQKMSPEFTKALPAHISPEKFIRVVVTAVQLDPKLLQADRRTLYSAAMRAATDGLLPDKREGVITVFGNEAVWMPMVAGLCKKARNSGEIASIDALVVCENDTYRSWVDEKGQHFNHEKPMHGGERGPVILTYAYAITKDGGFYFEEIDEDQMAAIEKSSKAGGKIWQGAFRDEMRRKSAIRRLAKYRLPSSTDLDSSDSMPDDPGTGELQVEATEITPPKTQSSRLSKIVETQTVKEPTQPVAKGPAGQAEPNEDPNVPI